jgi:hypothetical protein
MLYTNDLYYLSSIAVIKIVKLQIIEIRYFIIFDIFYIAFNKNWIYI